MTTQNSKSNVKSAPAPVVPVTGENSQTAPVNVKPAEILLADFAQNLKLEIQDVRAIAVSVKNQKCVTIDQASFKYDAKYGSVDKVLAADLSKNAAGRARAEVNAVNATVMGLGINRANVYIIAKVGSGQPVYQTLNMINDRLDALDKYMKNPARVLGETAPEVAAPVAREFDDKARAAYAEFAE